jgi:hypothetical protein
MDMNFHWTTRSEKLQVVAYWWEEQKGKCCICFKPMEPYKRQNTPHPQAATIEHLIPRRENGPNTVGNVRLAHAWCNHALGGLWMQNQHRALKGLPPLTQEQALGGEMQRKSALSRPTKRSIRFHKDDVFAPESPYYNLWVAWKAEREAKELRKFYQERVSLPRGATLTPEYQQLIGRHITQKKAFRMTATETAQWLAKQGVRGA